MITLGPRHEEEKTCIGCMLCDHDKIPVAVEKLGEGGEAINIPIHRAAYRAIIKLWREGYTVDPRSIATEVVKKLKDEPFEVVENIITDIELSVIAPEAFEYHADILVEAMKKENLFRISQRFNTQAQDGDLKSDDVISEMMTSLMGLAVNNTGEREWSTVTESALNLIQKRVADYRSTGRSSRGLPTGIPDLDEMLGGYCGGRLYVVGGRPGMGKTSFALSSVRAMLQQQHHVGLFSVEMGGEELCERLLCADTDVESYRIRSGALNDSDHGKLITSGMAIADNALHIRDDISSVTRIIATMKLWKSRYDIKAVVIDYLQLLRIDISDISRSSNLSEKVGKVSAEFKRLSRELDIPVILLSQLSRASVHRGAKEQRPVLSDLRDSGSIEQDADAVIFPNRPELQRISEEWERAKATGTTYTPPKVEDAELILAKQRNGPVGVVPAKFYASKTLYCGING